MIFFSILAVIIIISFYWQFLFFLTKITVAHCLTMEQVSQAKLYSVTTQCRQSAALAMKLN